jgi:hypothetical protein
MCDLSHTFRDFCIEKLSHSQSQAGKGAAQLSLDTFQTNSNGNDFWTIPNELLLNWEAADVANSQLNPQQYTVDAK